jgi:bifunctional non-homologous end joining protein LigD
MGVVTTRRVDQLREECRQAGVEFLDSDGRLELMDRLRASVGTVDLSLEVDPMKAQDTKKLVKLSADGPDYSGIAHLLTDQFVAEPKLDGARMRMFVGLTGSTLNTGRRSVRTYRYTDRSANFPHLSRVGHRDLAGVVLDGEIIAPQAKIQTHTGTWTNSLLNASVALCNSNPVGSVATQRRFGKAQFWVFDVLVAPGGESVQHLPYEQRRVLLEKIVELVGALYPDLPELQVVPQLSATEESIRESMLAGFEGVMLKRRSSKYEAGKRSHHWWKVKTMSTADGFVVGYNPGENANSGLVGSLNLAVDLGPVPQSGRLGENELLFDAPSGQKHVARAVAQVGNLTEAMRREISAPDGSLKPEYYGIVVEWVAQGLGKNGRARHAHMVRIRPDKGPEDCGEDQLEIFPAV